MHLNVIFLKLWVKIDYNRIFIDTVHKNDKRQKSLAQLLLQTADIF